MIKNPTSKHYNQNIKRLYNSIPLQDLKKIKKNCIKNNVR